MQSEVGYLSRLEWQKGFGDPASRRGHPPYMVAIYMGWVSMEKSTPTPEEREQHHRQANIYMARLAMAMCEAFANDDPQYEFLNESYRQAQTDLQLYDLGRHGSHYTIG